MTTLLSTVPCKEYFLAGSAIFTVSIPAEFAEEKGTKPWYTFQIRHKAKSDAYSEAWFVSMLTGPDNESDYTYVGMLDGATGELRLTAKSAYPRDSWPVKIVKRVLAVIWEDRPEAIIAAGWSVQHDGRCSRCGRTLTTPDSLARGLGPECAGKVGL